jgi:FdhE protein
MTIDSPWEQRIRRANDLVTRYTFAADPLRFYRQLTEYQQTMYESLRDKVAASAGSLDEMFPLRRLLQEHRQVLPRFPDFLRLICEIAPPVLSEAAATLRTVPEEQWGALLDAYGSLDLDSNDTESESGVIDFFPKAFLQPYAAALARLIRSDDEQANSEGDVAEGVARCPMCGARPQVSILRPEGHGASRSLACSLCPTEWRFKRVHCVACGEEEFERLVNQYAEEFPHVRMSACNTCRTYIKEVDLAKELQAVPVVDEIATMPLDVIAAERGYHKLELNLIGM